MNLNAYFWKITSNFRDFPNSKISFRPSKIGLLPNIWWTPSTEKSCLNYWCKWTLNSRRWTYLVDCRTLAQNSSANFAFVEEMKRGTKSGCRIKIRRNRNCIPIEGRPIESDQISIEIQTDTQDVISRWYIHFPRQHTIGQIFFRGQHLLRTNASAVHSK